MKTNRGKILLAAENSANESRWNG